MWFDYGTDLFLQYFLNLCFVASIISKEQDLNIWRVFVYVSNWYFVFQTFQNEIYSRQQILHAIVAEGHQMIRNGDVDDYSDFEHKLNMLQDQWQSVLRRSQQRRVVIDNLLHQWQTYDDNMEQLNHRLDLIAQSLSDMDIHMAPLQKIRNLYSNVKVLVEQLIVGVLCVCGMWNLLSFYNIIN